MQRRAFLRTGGAGLALALGTVSAPVTAGAGDAGEPFEPLGIVDVRDAAEAVPGDDGETVSLAVSDGFATVDVSDPAEPTVLADRRDLAVDGRPLTDVLDVAVDGDRLVVAGPAHHAAGDAFHGVVVYDVSDPSDPVRAGEPYEAGFHIHNCVLDGEILYLVGNDLEVERDGDRVADNPLVVVDLAGGEPEELARWSVLDHEPAWADVDRELRYLHDVTVRDDVAVLAHWNAGTYLLDVSDPADPRYRAHVADTSLEEQRELAADDPDDAYYGLPGNDHYAALDESGEVLAVGRESWATEAGEPSGAGGIDLYDASDPADPVYRATIDAPAADDASYRGGEWTTAHNFELRDGRLYSSWYQGGVAVHDVADPADPVELARWEDRETAGFWTARVLDGETIIASSTTLIPNAPTEGALYTFPNVPEPGADDEGPNGTDDRDGGSVADEIPGFTPLAALAGGSIAGGALALERIRRRRLEE